jgi:hypothetical protein
LYSFHMDKATWILHHEPLAPTRIFPCLSSTTHQGIALKYKKKNITKYWRSNDMTCCYGDVNVLRTKSH